MTERVLIMRHASGLVNRARRFAMTNWPGAKLEVHDLAAYGKPPVDFRWDRYATMLIDDEYLRREGLLWISELRAKPKFPKIVRVPVDAARNTPPDEIAVKAAPPLPPPVRKVEPSLEASLARKVAAQTLSQANQPPQVPPQPLPVSRAATRPPAPPLDPNVAAKREERRLADADAVLKAAGIQGFKPIKALGSGATANVCLCERMTDQELVVLKVLKSEGSGDSDLLSRFVQEYFAASSIDSPYVAKVYEHGFTDSHAYIVMEYFSAGDLRARIARDRPNVDESMIIVGSMLSALTSVHSAGIIHRDLKPANVMFREDGTIALVDFGSARRDADPVAKTLAGVVIGTPYYLSPEQALGGTADERSDLYSVGVMLYELLTGQRMYAAASLVGLFEMHKTAPIPPLPPAHARYQRFFEQLVSKKPSERYASASDALVALMDYTASEAERPETA
jgi:hypothetical protein